MIDKSVNRDIKQYSKKLAFCHRKCSFLLRVKEKFDFTKIGMSIIVFDAKKKYFTQCTYQ